MKNSYRTIVSSVLLLLLLLAVSCNSTGNLQSNQSHENHNSHLMKINEQGEKAMGFSHKKTTHHFRLFAGGGAIEVTAKDAQDSESLDQIRKHLSHIAGMFSQGNFEAPVLTHGKTPPGASQMQKMKDRINYKYEDIERGGRVRISTADKEALPAIYEFLRFQISDHQTGDSTDITKE